MDIVNGKHLAANGYMEGICSDTSKEQVTVVPGIVEPHQEEKGLAIMNKSDKSITFYPGATGSAPPIKQPPCRQPFGKRDVEKKEIQKMLDRGIIEPSNSPRASPIVLVSKKDGTTRFCVDYRKLNDVTVKDGYPLPRVDECLDALAGSKWFNCMDLTQDFGRSWLNLRIK